MSAGELHKRFSIAKSSSEMGFRFRLLALHADEKLHLLGA
jgi:hypothetical protein